MVDVGSEADGLPVVGAPSLPFAPADVDRSLEPSGVSASAIGAGEPLGAGVQRVCLNWLDQAIAAFTGDGDRDTGYHSARKAMKRVRAMIRLVRDTVGYAVYRNENVVLRDTARRIAPVRDSAVLVGTLDAIVERYRSGLAPDAFSGLRERLTDRHREAVRRVGEDRQLLGDVVTTLRVSRIRFATWPLEPSASSHRRRAVPDEYGAIAGGIHRVYRRGFAGMEEAYADRTTAAFHQWRKRVKYLRYQMEALEPLWPEMLGAYARSLDDLGESLGLEHDLAVLDRTLACEPDLCPLQGERRLLGALVLHERAMLRHSARRLGRLAYAEPPEVFVSRIGSYWEAARRA